MLPTWSLAYLAGWVAATAVVFLAGRYLNDRRAPAAHSVTLSVIAGFVWPMLIFGALQFAAVAVYVKVRDWRASAEVPEFWISRVVVAGSVPLR